jgi:hypothetical protein
VKKKIFAFLKDGKKMTTILNASSVALPSAPSQPPEPEPGPGPGPGPTLTSHTIVPTYESVLPVLSVNENVNASEETKAAVEPPSVSSSIIQPPSSNPSSSSPSTSTTPQYSYQSIFASNSMTSLLSSQNTSLSDAPALVSKVLAVSGGKQDPVSVPSPSSQPKIHVSASEGDSDAKGDTADGGNVKTVNDGTGGEGASGVNGWDKVKQRRHDGTVFSLSLSFSFSFFLSLLSLSFIINLISNNPS